MSIVLNQKDVKDATISMLLAAGVKPEDTRITMDPRYKHQVTAFVLALAKNIEREQRYDGLWEAYGLGTCASNAQSKAIRMEHWARRLGMVIQADTLAAHDDAMDDALDLINYGAFCARLVDKSAREAGLEATT